MRVDAEFVRAIVMLDDCVLEANQRVGAKPSLENKRDNG